VVGLAVLLAGCQGESPIGPAGGPGPELSGGIEAPVPPGGYPPSWVPGQVICELGAGYTIEDVHALFGTSTLDHIAGTDVYLVATPAGVPEEQLAEAMRTTLYCDIAERNLELESPEAERYSVAFYEGTFDYGDYIDQDALSRIGAPAAHVQSTGVGVKIAVIDTGIDLDHPALADKIGQGYDLVDDDPTPEDMPNYIDEDGDGWFDEAAGHGTHVAGIVSAVAPGATLLPYRVLNSDGFGTAFDVTHAVRMAIDDGAQVINLSLGMSERVESLREAIRDAADLDILVVAAAGNRGIEDRYHFPASENATVMAVTATDADDRKASFASYGSHIDISAPGVGIMSTYWNGGYAIWSGTSMATPFGSGAGALAIALDPWVGDKTQHLIEDSAHDIDDPPHMWVGLIGEGRVQLDDLVTLVMQGIGGGGDVSRRQ
jgi:subtilisin family serine protease